MCSRVWRGLFSLVAKERQGHWGNEKEPVVGGPGRQRSGRGAIRGRGGRAVPMLGTGEWKQKRKKRLVIRAWEAHAQSKPCRGTRSDLHF